MGKGRKRCTSRANKKSKNSRQKNLEKERLRIVETFQQIAMSHYHNKSSDSSIVDASPSMLQPSGKRQTSFPRKDSSFDRADVEKSDADNASIIECSRCKHDLKVPPDFSQPPYEKASGFIERCEVDVNFIQALVWLKSATVYVPNLPVEQLQRTFNRQWCKTEVYNVPKSNNSHQRAKRAKQSGKNPGEEAPAKSDGIDVQKIIAILSPQKIFDSSQRGSTRGGDSIRAASPEITGNDFSTEVTMLSPRKIFDPSCMYRDAMMVVSPDNPEASRKDFSTGDSNETVVPVTSAQRKYPGYVEENSNGVASLLDEDLEIDWDWDCNLSETFDSWAENEIAALEINETVRVASNDFAEGRANRVAVDTVENRSDTTRFFGSTFENVFTRLEKAAAKSPVEGRANKVAESTVDVENKSGMMRSFYNTFEKDSAQFKTPVAKFADLSSERHKPISPFEEANHALELDCDFDDSFITQPSQPINESLSKHSPGNFIPTLDNIFQRSKKSWGEFDSFQIGPSFTGVFNNDGNTVETAFDEFNDPDEEMIVDLAENSVHDNALSVVLDDRVVDETAKLTASCTQRNKRVFNAKKRQDPNHLISCNYSLRSRNKSITAIKPVASFCTYCSSPDRTEQTNIETCKKQSLTNDRKRGRQRKNNMISSYWLNFTLDSLNVEYAILESVKVILATLSDRRVAEEQMVCSQWKNTLNEKAVNAVLDTSNIFRSENKSDILRKEIVATVIKTLDEIFVSCAQLNQIPVNEYRMLIILEFCNSMSVNVLVTDYLIMKLKFFQSTLAEKQEMQWDVVIQQLQFIFYALNIVLQKYRAVERTIEKSRAETTIRHVADLWKMSYVDEEPELAKLNLNDAEERWREALQDFALKSLTTMYLLPFCTKSHSLTNMLIPQYILNKT